MSSFTHLSYHDNVLLMAEMFKNDSAITMCLPSRTLLGELVRRPGSSLQGIQTIIKCVRHQLEA